MNHTRINLLAGKKIYFASDFHLGVPNHEASIAREKRIIAWLETIKHDAAAVYLLGDIFDFWYEYKHAIPKGFIRLLGKLAELRDDGLPIYFFTGNHDIWMFDYFPRELNIPVYKDPIVLEVNQHKILIGHGDGLGPGDRGYKLLKKYVFTNPLCIWLFARLHPNLGIGLAHRWSRSSRITNMKREEKFFGENEFLLAYCKAMEKTTHHDFYIFGHRHLPLDLEAGNNSRYINLGEWVNYNTYAVYDGNTVELKTWSA